MNQQDTIQFLRNDHQELKQAVDSLSSTQLTEIPVIEEWTAKDILAHICAWNWEEIKAIDEVLVNKKPWYVGVEEDEFNQKEVEKRKSWPLEKMLKEWEGSFTALIERMEKLSPKEWEFEAGLIWPDRTPLSVKSLFNYRYEGAGHEGGHAKQIMQAKGGGEDV